MVDFEQEIKGLKKRGLNNPISLSRMAKITAAGLDKAATQYAFKIYWDKNFLRLAKIDSLDQIEQDRIFNELILACMILIMLTLESPDLNVPREMKDYYLTVKDEIPQAHIEQLKELGIERKHRKLWQKLIKMRYDEYYEDRLKVRDAAMTTEAKEKGELNTKDILDIQMILPVQTVAFDTFAHITQHKTKGNEDLLRFIVRSLGKFYIEIRIPVEGGKITAWKRVMLKLKRLFR